MAKPSRRPTPRRWSSASSPRRTRSKAFPRFGEFDLVWAVNDAINYLLDVEELERALAGMRANLAPGGVILFDVNTLAAYRGFFAEEVVVERAGRRFVWRGLATADDAASGSIFEARFDGDGAGVQAHTHRQRHFAEVEVLGAMKATGLECVEITGERDGELDPVVDEELHTKAVYLCRRAAP